MHGAQSAAALQENLKGSSVHSPTSLARHGGLDVLGNDGTWSASERRRAKRGAAKGSALFERATGESWPW